MAQLWYIGPVAELVGKDRRNGQLIYTTNEPQRGAKDQQQLFGKTEKKGNPTVSQLNEYLGQDPLAAVWQATLHRSSKYV